MQGRASSLPSNRRLGFTLVELMVALVILAILSGVVIPRLAAGSSRTAEAEVRRVAELVSAAGRRDTLTSQQLAVDFDGSTFSLLLFRRPSPSEAARGVAPEWVRDSMTMPVTLRDAAVVSVSADGMDLDPRRFRVEFLPGATRPGLRLVLTQTDGQSRWTLALSPRAFRATVTSGEDVLAGAETTMIDLDLAGKADEPW